MHFLLNNLSYSVASLTVSDIGMTISDIGYSHSDRLDFLYDCYDITLCCRYNTKQTFKAVH